MNKKNCVALCLAGLVWHSVNACAYNGIVVDAATGKPLAGAFVTSGENVVRTDASGAFDIAATAGALGVRAYGHVRREVSAERLKEAQAIPLAPFKPKALYLSVFGVGNTRLRQAALRLIGQTELNAVVIDVKGDRGLLAYKSGIPLARTIGAERAATVRNMASLVGQLHREGLYAIARIVVFKDTPLALARPELAVRTLSGAIWRDREDLAWTDPFKKQVWDYNIDVAVEAAKMGFDEIQFDYVRFPDDKGLMFSKPNTEASRVAAITGFLSEARKRLLPYNVFLAADIFGYVLWNRDDTQIGQKLENLANVLDYISPMLYPSGFQYGIPGYRNPVLHPGEIVSLSLRRAQRRTGLPAVRFRPWLQAFRDYAFGGQAFGAAQIRAQIEAAQTFGSNGWMLWNPRNVYTANGLLPKSAADLRWTRRAARVVNH